MAHAWMPEARRIRADTDGGPLIGGAPRAVWLTLGTAPGGVKAALALMGMSIGPSRSPIAPLPPDKQQKMRAALQQAGML